MDSRSCMRSHRARASDGCPTSGGTNETLAAKAVIDWLNDRVPGYTTRSGDIPAVASWTTGKVGMMGTSYNGTIPEAVATTGVEGLEAIVPISAISDWYDYYRANGMVRAPHSSSNPTGNNNVFQGEDLDVLADGVYSRIDEVGQRTICQPVIDYLATHQDRATGNRSGLWQERNYMKDVENVHAATLLAHGNNDFNVMTKNAAQFCRRSRSRTCRTCSTSTRAVTAERRRTCWSTTGSPATSTAYRTASRQLPAHGSSARPRPARRARRR